MAVNSNCHSSRRSRSRFRFAMALLICFAACWTVGLCADDDRSTLESGPEVGSDVTSFYVRAVTGPLAGKSVCYVCRNGDRPVAMIFLRELGKDSSRLLRQLDRLVNDHRADGLRCFVVLLTDKSQVDSARLQTLSFDEKLAIPLTVATDTSTNDSNRRIAPDAAVTVVLYNRLKVAARFGYRTGECDDAACESILNATDRLVRDSSK